MNNKLGLTTFAAAITFVLAACGSPDEKKESYDKENNQSSSESTHSEAATDSVVDISEGISKITLGDGSVIYESVAIGPELKFDKAKSLAAFERLLYPYLRSLPLLSAHGEDRPLYADDNVELAHEYALTQVNFYDTSKSKMLEDVAIFRKHCVNTCVSDSAEMLRHINNWKRAVSNMLYFEQPTGGLADDGTIEYWIDKDKETVAPEDAPYMVYASFHQLRNYGFNAAELNIARVALSKALNSTARWAPEIVNPVDVNGQGLLYRFDIRDYWGWNKGVTDLLFGGSDDNLYPDQQRTDYLGRPVDLDTIHQRYNFADSVTQDPELAKTIWQRILHGSVEEPSSTGNPAAKLDGFIGPKSENAAGDYIEAEELKWVDAGQLVYTLTRGSVYASIMMLPMFADELEEELGVDKSAGMDSYEYFVTYDAHPIDAQFALKGKRSNGGFFWKTFELMTIYQGTQRNIHDIYAENGEDIRFPFWAHPIPLFLNPDGAQQSLSSDPTLPQNWSFVATLSLIDALNNSAVSEKCQPIGDFACAHYDDIGGRQQSESTIIWDLPNGLNGYMRAGTFNQRRIEATQSVIRDFRLHRDFSDGVAYTTGYYLTSDNKPTLTAEEYMNAAGSYIGLYPDGLQRTDNDLRDWLEYDIERLPRGPYGVDQWINDEAVVKRVKELYPTTAESKDFFENARKQFMLAMDKIQNEMILGLDKNSYVEPVTWLSEVWLKKGSAILKGSGEPATPPVQIEDKALDGCIDDESKANPTSLTYLSCTFVEDLTGLEKFTNLEVIFLSARISEFDFSHFANLQRVTLQDTQIEQLNIEASSNIESLNVSSTNLTSVNIQSPMLKDLTLRSVSDLTTVVINAPGLESLNINKPSETLSISPSQSLKSLDLTFDLFDDQAFQIADFPNLETLGLQIGSSTSEEIDLSSLVRLTKLKVNLPPRQFLIPSYNAITTLSIENLDTDEPIELSQFNQLNSLFVEDVILADKFSLEGLAALERIEIERSKLAHLGLSDLPGLQFFSLDGSLLTELNLTDSPQLKDLFLDGSTISIIDLANIQVTDFNLKDVDGIEQLRVVDTGIREIAVDSTIKKVELKSNHNLYELFISGEALNLSNIILSDLPSLQTLGVFSSRATEELDLTKLSDLDMFVYGGFNLAQASVNSDNKISQLIVDYSNEEHIDFSSYPNITNLQLWGEIKSIDISHNNQLKQMHVEAKLMESIDLSPLVKLQRLDLHNTLVKQLDLSSNVNLEEAYLGLNKLESIVLPHHPDLQNVDLNSNQLSCDDIAQFADYEGVNFVFGSLACP